jgi:HD-like signal output (HDOD) protein
MTGHTAESNRHTDSVMDERSLVEARLARIQEASDFPALSRQIIDTISLIDDDASSLQRLANVVLREYSLTLSVVRTANTVHYRRTGRPIQSATHAMMMLGAKTVRHLASSLLLFENYSKRSPVLKELMVMSLITANHAREISSRLERADPEEAHLCGMFRNLGEVLIACHFPDDYARIQERVHELGQSVSGAANNVLGFRYEDLAVAVSRHWGMPDTVVQGIRARPGAVTSDVSGITAFSHDLTLSIYRQARGAEPREPADAERAVHDAMDRHAAHLKISREQVRDVVEAALDETRELFTSAKVPMESHRLKELADAARTAMGLSATPTGEWEIEAVDLHDAPGSPALRRRLRQELESKVDATSGAELGEVLLLALEAALRGGPFDR